MRKFFTFLAVTLISLSSTPLAAGFSDPKGPQIRSSAFHSFGASVDGPGVPESNNQDLSVSKGTVEGLGGLKIYDKTAILLGLGYEVFRLDWGPNPSHVQEIFHNASATVGLYTKLIEDWRWMALVRMTMNVENGTFDDATTWRGMIWGKYAWKDNVNLHIGAVGTTGIEDTSIYPLAGFDWRINDEWLLEMIFPVKMAINYFITEQWIVSAQARFLKERQRLSGVELNSSGIFEYLLIGGELALSYKTEDPDIVLSLAAGYTGYQELETYNRNGGMKQKYDVGNSAFIGLKGNIEFPMNRK